MSDRAGLCLRYGSQLRCLLQRKSRAPLGALLLKIREKQKGHPLDVLFVVREAGVEPARPCEHWHLKPASLPIPPLARGLECTVCSVHEIYYHILPPVSTLFFLHRPFCKSQALNAHNFSLLVLSNFDKPIWPPSYPMVGSLCIFLFSSPCSALLTPSPFECPLCWFLPVTRSVRSLAGTPGT